MTDFALKFTNQATFEGITRVVYEMLSGSTLNEGDSTPRQGLSLTGTHWFVDEIGLFYDENSQPMDGWYANLRWNGGDQEPPSNIPGMEIIWRSDAVDDEGNSIPLPQWWNRIIA